MRFFSYVKDARKTILSNKMRSTLSTLGIVIGMAAVIVMMAIGQGMDNLIVENMGEMSKNTLTISAGGGYQDVKEDGTSSYVRKVNFDTSIIDYLEHYFPELRGQITYQLYGSSSQVKIGSKSEGVSSMGVPQSWFRLNEKDIVMGNNFTDEQYRDAAFVAIINDSFKTTFFANKENPIGKKILFDKKQYTIVGVLEKGQMEWGSQIYIPDTTVQRLTHKTNLDSFMVFLPPTADNTLWNHRVTYLLMKKFNIQDAGSAGFHIHSFADFVKQINQTTGMMKSFLLFIGGTSLLIGGIGVMNIMIVSVTERTREIGIRKAIGALNRDIIMQFLIESVVITFIGGVLALILSFGVVKLIATGLAGASQGDGSTPLKPVINLSVVVTSFCLTAMTGIVFGIMPARKAAKLKPIDALRFE